MVNGLHLYRAVIPKALRGASHATTTSNTNPAMTSRPASPPELLSPYINTYKQCNRFKKIKERFPPESPPSWIHSSPPLAFYFCLSPSWSSSTPPLLLPLFLLLFAKYPEFPSVLHICVILQSPLPLPPPWPLDWKTPLWQKQPGHSGLREGKVLHGISCTASIEVILVFIVV